MVGPDGPDHLDVPCAAYPRHLRTERLCDLHGESPDTARRTDDEHRLAGLDVCLVPKPLQRGRRRQGNGRGLLEREVLRLRQEVLLRHARVFGVGAPARAKYLFAGSQLGRVLADSLDHTRHVEARDGVLRPAQPGAGQAKKKRAAADEVPVRGVD